MKVLGLRISRYSEWLGVVRAEGRRLGWRALAAAFLLAIRGGLVSRGVWRQRMRNCASCPVYDQSRHTCRDTDGRGLGCGCWMPLKAMWAGNQCWLRTVDPQSPWGHRE